jgi:hypothetical protein
MMKKKNSPESINDLNGQVVVPNLNVYKILDVLRKQETLTGIISLTWRN